MATEDQIETILKMTLEIGELRGKLVERERSRDELKGLLDAIQDDLDLMRERAARAEALLSDRDRVLAGMSRAVDGC